MKVSHLQSSCQRLTAHVDPGSVVPPRQCFENHVACQLGSAAHELHRAVRLRVRVEAHRTVENRLHDDGGAAALIIAGDTPGTFNLAQPAPGALGEPLGCRARRCHRERTPATTEVAWLTMPTKPANSITPPAVDLATTADSNPSTGLRLLGAAMVVILLGELLLGMANTFWLHLPDSGSGWTAGSSSGLLGIHMILGAALVALAVWIIVAAVRGRDRNWIIASSVGAVGILIAAGSGMAFMGHTENNLASFCMAVGCAVAIAGYALGLYGTAITSRD